MTPADPRSLESVLRRPWRLTRRLWLGAAAVLLASILITGLLRAGGGRRAVAVTTALDLDRPAIAPSGSPARHPRAARPGVRPEFVPAAPGAFTPARGADR